MSELVIPSFASEAEEAAWWEANEDALADEFERAAAEGRIGFSTLVVTGDSTVAKICLDPEDITNAREQAAKRGLRCHACLTLIIQEAAQCGRLAERSLALNSCFPRVRAVDRFHSAPTGRRVRGGPLTQGASLRFALGYCHVLPTGESGWSR